MNIIKKPKIGLVGVMCTPFRGNKEGNYRASRSALEGLAQRFDFELYVIDEGVYNLEQAESATRQLQGWNVDFILLQSSSFASGDFIYPFAALPARLGLWAVPEGPPTSEGGLPLNSFTGANLYNSILKTEATHYNRPVKWFFGNPGQPLFDERLDVTIKALRGIINLQGARIGLVGGVAPSFNNLIIDNARLKDRLQISVIDIELDEILQTAERVANEKVQATVKAIGSRADRLDLNQAPTLTKTARVNLALQDVARERGLQAVAVSCWPRFQSDYNLAVCTVLGNLNTEGLVAACEGDVPSAAGMLALHAMSNGDTVTLMDLVTVDPEDESILLWHCGPTSPSMADEGGTHMEPLWLFDGPDGKQVGLHNDLVLKPGRGTVMGFTADFDRVLIVDGVIDNQKPSYKGSRGWFRSLRLNTEPVTVTDLVQSIMTSGFQHHYPFAFGNFAEASMELAVWLGITPIPVNKYTPYVK